MHGYQSRETEAGLPQAHFSHVSHVSSLSLVYLERKNSLPAEWPLYHQLCWDWNEEWREMVVFKMQGSQDSESLSVLLQDLSFGGSERQLPGGKGLWKTLLELCLHLQAQCFN